MIGGSQIRTAAVQRIVTAPGRGRARVKIGVRGKRLANQTGTAGGWHCYNASIRLLREENLRPGGNHERISQTKNQRRQEREPQSDLELFFHHASKPDAARARVRQSA